MSAAAGCAGGSNGTTGTGGSTGAGGSPTGGSTGAGGASSTGGTTGSGGATATGGTTGTGGAVATGGATGTGGVSATGGATGTGGVSATGGATGTGGTPATGGTTGTGGASATGGSTGTGGATSSGFCPSGALFCADFEEASGVPMNHPVGSAAFEDPSEYGWTFGGTSMAAMILDTTSPFDGKQSLKVNAPSGFAIRTLYVSVPATFWVRLYIKSDMAIGQSEHNSFFAAGTDPDYSKANNVEVSEQFNCVLLNKSDSLYPSGTTCGVNTALAANAWHCMAAMFDGTTGNVQVYAGTTQIINAQAWAPAKETFTTFSFGYFDYNNVAANVWYDDVVVSTQPLACPAGS